METYESTTARTTRALLFWTLTWVVSLAFAAFGPRFFWDYATVPTVLGVLLNIAMGIGMVLANRDCLAGMDELDRKIFLDAAALTLGAGLVAGSSYEILEDIRLITPEPEISHLIMFMGLTFMAGMVRGRRKYQ